MIIKNRNTIDTDSFGTSGLNMLEKFCAIVLPLLLGGIIYSILREVTGLIWWWNLTIAISIWVILIALIFMFSWWAAENEILKY